MLRYVLKLSFPHRKTMRRSGSHIRSSTAAYSGFLASTVIQWRSNRGSQHTQMSHSNNPDSGLLVT
jgi:hypothetical protein